MKRLNDRMQDVERMIDSNRLYLEDMAHKQERSGELCAVTYM